MSKTDALLISFMLGIAFVLGMLIDWLLTMRRQRWYDEYAARKKSRGGSGNVR